MIQNNKENNSIIVLGKIASEPEFNHKVYGEGFYTFNIDVKRLSESSDRLPITISERLIDAKQLKIGNLVEIQGQFRSYNNYTSEGNKLVLTIFAQSVKLVEDAEKIKNPNLIMLLGFICKKPTYRNTPFGREITDILLAVNRSYNKSDYIPCIAWGRNARFADSLKVGDNVRIWGRIQSREYQKKMQTGEVLTKTAFEVSVSKIENINDDDKVTDEDL
jgi:single-stranded DNA-binding protein